MFTKDFWKAASERAIKTFAQVLAALLVADGTDVLNTVWHDDLSVAGMAAIISLLTSIGSGAATGTGPSAFGPEVVPEEVAN